MQNALRLFTSPVAPQSKLLKGYANVTFEALPYHRLGTQKYAFLGREYPMGEVSLPAGVAERVQAIVDEERGAK